MLHAAAAVFLLFYMDDDRTLNQDAQFKTQAECQVAAERLVRHDGKPKAWCVPAVARVGR